MKAFQVLAVLVAVDTVPERAKAPRDRSVLFGRRWYARFRSREGALCRSAFSAEVGARVRFPGDGKEPLTYFVSRTLSRIALNVLSYFS